MEDDDIDNSEEMSDETTPRTKKHPKKNIGQTAIAPLKEKKEPTSIKEKPIEEQFNNPSINQSLRKSTKSMKKEERKSHKTAIKKENSLVLKKMRCSKTMRRHHQSSPSSYKVNR